MSRSPGCASALLALLATAGGVLQKSPGLLFLFLNYGFPLSPLVPQSSMPSGPGDGPRDLNFCFFMSVPNRSCNSVQERVSVTPTHPTAFPGAGRYTKY